MTRYVEDTYEIIARAYSEEFFDDKSDLPLINLLADSLRANATILDLGCGPGQFTSYLHEKGYLVEGIDNSTQMLQIAREKVPTGKFKKMDMRKLDYPNDMFDGVLAAYSLIHIPTKELNGVIDEIKRVLKPDGLVLAITQEGEPDQIMDEPLATGKKIFVNFFSKERIAVQFVSSGFKVIQQRTITQSNEDVLSSTSIGTLARLV